MGVARVAQNGIPHARAGRIVTMGTGDVCPASERLLAFAGDDGSVARMAIVRPPSSVRSARAPAVAPPLSQSASSVGRYVVGPKLATGGMASVHLGRLRGSAGFARTVAIKRLLPTLASDPEFVARFVEEARIASRVRHANVVPTLDVVDVPEVLLVLEYIHGESLARLLRLAAARDVRCPPNVASTIVIGVLRGLHSAHEAKGSNGIPLDLVHRDVSPQNVLVGADGVARVLDFGIAKAAGREQSTINRAKASSNDLRGKLAYMAPEQVAGEPIDRRADLFAAGVMLWETLAGDRLFRGEDAVSTMEAIFHRDPPLLSSGLAKVSARVDEVLATALAKDAAQRYSTADEMARAIETALPPASAREVAEWVDAIAAEILSTRSAILARFEGSTESGEEQLTPEPGDATTEKRSPLLPPVLPNAVPPKMRDESKTVPGFDPSQMPGALAPIAAPNDEPLRTPMSMVRPAVHEPHDPLAASGMTSTRIGLVAPRPSRATMPPVTPPSAPPSAPPSVSPLRTPIPMPMAAAKPRMSLARVAAYVLVPPAIAALSLVFLRPAISSARTNANAEAPPVVAEDPPPIPAPPSAAPPPSTPAPPPRGAMVTAASTPAAPAPTATSPRARGPRPWGRPPRKR